MNAKACVKKGLSFSLGILVLYLKRGNLKWASRSSWFN